MLNEAQGSFAFTFLYKKGTSGRMT